MKDKRKGVYKRLRERERKMRPNEREREREREKERGGDWLNIFGLVILTILKNLEGNKDERHKKN